MDVLLRPKWRAWTEWHTPSGFEYPESKFANTTAFDAALPRHSLASARRDEYEQQERQQRETVIAEFDAGDTDATLQATATEILRYRQLKHGCFQYLRPFERATLKSD